MQKKLLVTLISSAFAGYAGVASAGPISVASVGTYAVEAMGASVAVAVGNIAYTLTSPFAINSIQNLRYTLDSKIGTCPTVTLSPAVAGAVVSAPGAPSADGLNCTYTVTVGANPVPANQTINFVDAKVSSSAALAVDGGKITGTISVLDNGLNLVESNTATVAQSAQAFTATIVSSASLTPNPERSRVDITTTPTPGVTFTNPADVTNSTTTINLGRIRLTETPGVQLFSDGKTEVNFANATVQNLTTTVAGSFLTTGATLNLSSNANCVGGVLGAAINPIASATSNKFSNVNIVALAADADGNKNVYICYTVPGNKVIPTAQFTADALIDTGIAAATDLTDEQVAVTNIYNLGLNGVQIDIRNHIPTAVTGWTNAYRIINTGSVAASFTAQYIGVDGVAGGTSGVIAANVPAGGTVVVSVPQVEAVLGAAPAAPAGVGPRLRITAPTDSARVQVYGVQPNGNIFLNSDAQGADNGGTDK